MTDSETKSYDMSRFIEDVQRIMDSGQERAAIVSQVEPLLKRVTDREDLL